ncbi:hypothetical protein FACS189494_00350 [Spirochaetia bacterium]|nr:hypothetical protein FACS189494_00350 [Spirochaetia bacterium]
MRQSARSVNNVVPVRFLMSHNGAISIEDDRGFPSLRDFPIFDSSITTGKKWIAAGKCAVDPLNDGNVITYPFLAEYEYKGTEDYQNIPVHHINAKYASRMKGSGVQGEDQLTSLNGSHNVDIFISVADGTPVFQRDYLDETYSWRSGKSVRLSGFILTFGNRSIKLDIKTKKEIEEGFVTVKGVDVVPLDTGLRLTVKELQFKSDSDELAAGEKNRLDAIAAVLAKAPADKTFLVEGHTAAIGHDKNEMELSLRRAKRIVAEMTTRGIMEQRFIYRGSGGTKPVGDNASETGRAQNRRVEITILE